MYRKIARASNKTLRHVLKEHFKLTPCRQTLLSNDKFPNANNILALTLCLLEQTYSVNFLKYLMSVPNPILHGFSLHSIATVVECTSPHSLAVCKVINFIEGSSHQGESSCAREASSHRSFSSGKQVVIYHAFPLEFDRMYGVSDLKDVAKRLQ